MRKAVLQTRQMARFALEKKFSNLNAAMVSQMKNHLLDALASMISCFHNHSVQKVSKQIALLSCGEGIDVPVLGKIPVDRAAQYYTALIRYLDFMDNFLAKEATCHPSDNIGPVLAACSYMDYGGKEFITSMATAYEMECRLIEEVPVMMQGFDHTLLLSYSLSAVLSRLFRLKEQQAAHAIAISGCMFNPLVTCRASYTREWKGFQSSMVALGCVNTVLLAKQNMTGPIDIFEGHKGFFKEFEMGLDYNWKNDSFDLLKKCVLKKYNAEVHTQSLIDAAVELRNKYAIKYTEIESVTVTTFLTAYHIVGGGEYGSRKIVVSKEQADHSLPYVIAVALIDGDVYPQQFTPERINRQDVQLLLKKVKVKTRLPFREPKKLSGMLDPYTQAYPEKVMGKVTIKMKKGKTYSLVKEDFHGFFTDPMSFDDVAEKFKRLTSGKISPSLSDSIIKLVSEFEKRKVNELVGLLQRAAVSKPSRKKVPQLNYSI
jgi:2-methylcitrate dehydratase